MQHAFAVVGGKRIERGLQIEECGPIFDHNGVPGFNKEVVYGAS
jgi:hypothetical protein